jgi:F420H(2)-dependent quinone reductase
VAAKAEPQFLYLSTSGWKTGKKHKIEIWFVEHDGRYYIISEHENNILHNPKVFFSIDNAFFRGTARIINREKESGLATQVSILMSKKYGWSKGVIVELVSLTSPST